jgi:Ras-related protein Rab-11A
VDKGENNLSFIETSALDASNVELAFQNILTGTPEFFLLLLSRNLVKLMSQRVI